MTIEKLNAATSTVAAERRRIPMSVPVLKLETAEIPGYHLHWFLNDASRIQRALDGGYEFVNEQEVKPNNVSLGGTSAVTGNMDLGTRVSIVSGQEVGKDGQPARLVLMKIKQEWWEEDRKVLEEKSKQVRDSLLGGMVGAEHETGADRQHRYVDKSRTAIPDFYKPKRSPA